LKCFLITVLVSLLPTVVTVDLVDFTMVAADARVPIMITAINNAMIFLIIKFTPLKDPFCFLPAFYQLPFYHQALEH
jgi:hypothetical protein